MIFNLFCKSINEKTPAVFQNGRSFFIKGYPDNPKFTPHIYNKNQYSHRTIKTVLYILVALYTFEKKIKNLIKLIQ